VRQLVILLFVLVVIILGSQLHAQATLALTEPGTDATLVNFGPYNDGAFGGAESGKLETDQTGIYITTTITKNDTVENLKFDASITGIPAPIPSAIWLFCSGLVGLIGVRRRFNKYRPY